MELKQAPKQTSKQLLDQDLNRLEAKIEELRLLYEQYFVDILLQAPEGLQKEVVRLIRKLLRAPFKTSAVRFRLRTLVTRYQTYHTYWARVLKQREEGTYSRDLFKAEIRDRAAEETKQEGNKSVLAEKRFKQLFESYEVALKKSGVSTEKLNFASFKKSLVKRAKQLQTQYGAKKLQYKVLVKNGKVIIKASPKG